MLKLFNFVFFIFLYGLFELFGNKRVEKIYFEELRFWVISVNVVFSLRWLRYSKFLFVVWIIYVVRIYLVF